MNQGLAVHGALASRCRAEANYHRDTKWSAGCTIENDKTVTVCGYNSIEEAIAELNDSLEKYNLTVRMLPQR